MALGHLDADAGAVAEASTVPTAVPQGVALGAAANVVCAEALPLTEALAKRDTTAVAE